MSLRVVAFRIMRVTAISLLILLLLAFSLIQLKQHLIRRDSERLLADFHSIRLNQTTWPEAKALMQRWGKMGHARGPCNSTDCGYVITVFGWPSLIPNGMATPWLDRLGVRFAVLRQRLGIRFSALELRFLVEDGVVRRTLLGLSAETEDEGYPSALLVSVRNHASLDGSDHALHTVGADEELGMHPDFIVGPDSFCSGCETISLVYTPDIALDELLRLTSFNLSCLTRRRPCPHLSDIAPALMREDAANFKNVPPNSVPCTTPAWALARDAGAIWAVDTLATAQVPDPYPLPGEAAPMVEEDRIRLIKIFKGPPRIAPQTVLRFRPYSGTEYEARDVPEHLKQGHRYILMPSTDDYDMQEMQKEGAAAWRCGVLDDTPANELAIKRGIAKDDHLREPELTEAWPW